MCYAQLLRRPQARTYGNLIHQLHYEIAFISPHISHAVPDLPSDDVNWLVRARQHRPIPCCAVAARDQLHAMNDCIVDRLMEETKPFKRPRAGPGERR